MNAPARTRKRRPPEAAPAGGAGGATPAEPASLRQRVLDAAVASLIELGTARTTTLEVQRRAGVSRGALLHHFPTHATLLACAVEEIVRRNEQAILDSLLKLRNTGDGLERAIRVLAIATSQPASLAELELWAVARTDPELLASLRQAERKARKESERVLGALFSPAGDQPALSMVVAMTQEFVRGLSLTGILRNNPARRQQLVAQWVRTAKLLLEARA